jgi:hypothetical protein
MCFGGGGRSHFSASMSRTAPATDGSKRQRVTIGGDGGNDHDEKLKSKMAAVAVAVVGLATRDGDGTETRGWSAIPTDVEALVFEFSAPRDRLVAIERVCRWWRDESRRGIGWTTTFDGSSAVWRDFVRLEERPLGGADADPVATFGDYLGRLGQRSSPTGGGRMSCIETLSNRGVAGGAVRRQDEALIALALASRHLRSVELVADETFRFARPLALAAPQITERLVLARAAKNGHRLPIDTSLGNLFSTLRPAELILDRINASPDAYRLLASGPAHATLTDLSVAAGVIDAAGAPHHLGYVDRLVVLRTLRLSNLTCVALPARSAASVRTLVCDRVVFSPSCYGGGDLDGDDDRNGDGADDARANAHDSDDGDDTQQRFRNLEAFTMVDAADSRFVCSVLRTNDATLERLHLTRLWRLALSHPSAIGYLYHTFNTCRFSALTSLGINASGLVGAWDALQLVLVRCIGRLVTLLLCDMTLDDAELVRLARIFNGRVVDESEGHDGDGKKTRGEAKGDVGAGGDSGNEDGGDNGDGKEIRAVGGAATIESDGSEHKAGRKGADLVLRQLSLANNAGITAAGILAFVCAVDLPHLTRLELRQAVPLVFSTADECVLRTRLPALGRHGLGF